VKGEEKRRETKGEGMGGEEEGRRGPPIEISGYATASLAGRVHNCRVAGNTVRLGPD